MSDFSDREKIAGLRGSILAAAVAAFCLVGCEDEGPAEEMGESLDEAGEEIRDGAEDAGDALDDDPRRGRL